MLHNTPRQHDNNGGGHDARAGDFITFTRIKVFVSLSGMKERSHAEAMQRQNRGVGGWVGQHAGLYQTTTVLPGRMKKRNRTKQTKTQNKQK